MNKPNVIPGGNISKWNKRFLEIVEIMTNWSKDPSSQFAALIVRPDRSIVAYGVNNFPRGIEDSEERLSDRPVKYDLIVHAETNALLHAHEDLSECTMYVGSVPCVRCAVNIIQSGISRVICVPPTEDYLSRWGDSVDSTMILFNEAGVLCYWE